MKNIILKSVVCGGLLAASSFPTFAGNLMLVGVESPSGCYLGLQVEIRAVEAGTQEFRDAVSYFMGVAETKRESCPDVHITITPSKQ